MDLLELSAYGNVRRGQDSGGCRIQWPISDVATCKTYFEMDSRKHLNLNSIQLIAIMLTSDNFFMEVHQM